MIWYGTTYVMWYDKQNAKVPQTVGKHPKFCRTGVPAWTLAVLLFCHFGASRSWGDEPESSENSVIAELIGRLCGAGVMWFDVISVDLLDWSDIGGRIVHQTGRRCGFDSLGAWVWRSGAISDAATSRWSIGGFRREGRPLLLTKRMVALWPQAALVGYGLSGDEMSQKSSV